MADPRPTKPGTATTEAGDGFIGVPDGYTIPATFGDWFRPDRAVTDSAGTIGATPSMPKYANGIEASLLDFTQEDIARLQIRLSKAGLIGPETKFRLGQVLGTSDATYTAFKKLLGAANTRGVGWDSMLTKLESQPQSRGDGKTMGADGRWTSGGATSQKRTETRTDVNEAMFTDPATARDTLRTAMESRLGRAATADEEARFRANLRAEEAGDQVTTTTSKYGRTGNLKSTVSTQLDDTSDASASTVADDFTRQGKLGKEANTRMTGVDYYGSILSLPGMGN